MGDSPVVDRRAMQTERADRVQILVQSSTERRTKTEESLSMLVITTLRQRALAPSAEQPSELIPP
jgi:hypothetical protein